MQSPNWRDLLLRCMKKGKESIKSRKGIKKAVNRALKEMNADDESTSKALTSALKKDLKKNRIEGFTVVDDVIYFEKSKGMEGKKVPSPPQKNTKAKRKRDDAAADDVRQKLEEQEQQQEQPHLVEHEQKKKKKKKKIDNTPTTNNNTTPPQHAWEIEIEPDATENDDVRWRASLKRTDVKSGAFSNAEKDLIRQGVRDFAIKHNLSTEDYSWILAGRGYRRGPVQGLWKSVAELLPHRTIKSVAGAGNRILHPHARKGKWTEAEDEELRQEVENHGPKWVEIGVRLGRSRAACRDRWREIQLGEKKNRGRWSEEEVGKLERAVKEYLDARKQSNKAGGAGSTTGGTEEEEKASDRRHVLDDINWSAVSRRVGTRNNIQCLEKWYDTVAPSMVERGEWGHGDDRRMLRAMFRASPNAEHQVEWGSLVEGRSEGQTKRRWRLMLKVVPNQRELEFVDILDYLVATYMPRLKERESKKGEKGERGS